MAKDLEYYLAQARRIAEHREAGVEKEIRKLYRAMAKDLQTFMSETYVQYAKDDKLTYGMLQAVGYDARFLQEIEQRLNISTPKAAEKLKKLIEDTYRAAYEEMVKGVAKKTPISETFAESIAITPEQIQRAVENPVSGLTLTDKLEKNRKEIIYNIKQAVGVGLMNGDRYTTMAKRIAEHVDGDYRKAIRIARTETHRVREAGNYDAAVKVDKELQNGTTGYRMVKVWKTMKDERVRPQRARKTKKGWKHSMGGGANHMKMQDQVVLAEEEFDLGGGVKAMSPGNSGDAGNDINCRCYASYEMMDDATYFKKTGKHFAEVKAGTLPTFDEADYEELDYETYKEEAAKAKYNEGMYWVASKDAVEGKGPKLDFSSEEAFDRINKVREAQRALYGGYVGTPNSFQINKYLRENEVTGQSLFERTILSIDNLAGSWKAPKKMQVTRFVTDEYLESTFGGKGIADILENVGSIITEKQFLSTSATVNKNEFASERKVRLKMCVDKGTPCFPTLNYSESEILFPRGTQYEIMGAEEKNGGIDILVRIL